MKLNLGAGRERMEGWISVDANPNANPDMVSDVRRLDLKDNSVDDLRAIDVIEHLPYREIVSTLREWHRVLKPGGTLYGSVPAADVVIQWWVGRKFEKLQEKLEPALLTEQRDLTGWNGLVWRLMGGQGDGFITREGDDPCLNLHQTLFSYSSLVEALIAAGFSKTTVQLNDHPNYIFTTEKH